MPRHLPGNTLPAFAARFIRASLTVAILASASFAWAQADQPKTPRDQSDAPRMSCQKTSFGRTAPAPEGQPIHLYTCTNAHGLQLRMCDYGAIVVSMATPDRNGQQSNVTLGFPDLEGYLQRHPYFGATVGRYCNRIAGGKFSLGDKPYTLATNNGPNHLHGGEVGLDKVVWEAQPVEEEGAVGVQFHYVSKDGEEGYPGNLDITATYTLTNDNELWIEFQATTDQPTPVNLTNHCYWNLAGRVGGTILDHELMLAANAYLEVDDTLIPTGKRISVARSPFDFRASKPIGQHLLGIPSDPVGYDHCFVLNNQSGKLAFAARVTDPKSGRVMEIHTTQPGIQLYTGNFLDGDPTGAGFKQYAGFCLETQHFPDSPNQPAFPSTILKPGEKYRQLTVHKFLVDRSRG